MFLMRAKLVSVKRGETNNLVLEGSYFDKVLEKDVPVKLYVMVDTNHVSRLPDYDALVGTVVDLPVKALVGKKTHRLFYVTAN